MRTGQLESNRADILYSILENAKGEWLEFFYSIVPREPERAEEQLAVIEQAEETLLALFEIAPRHVVAKRFFSSDLFRHRDILAGYRRRRNTDFFFSLVEQPPTGHVKLALLGLCLSNIAGKSRQDDLLLLDAASGVRHVFAERLLAADAEKETSAERQTLTIFEELESRLSRIGISLRDSVLRTWIYAPHVDADYPGIVRGRNEFFDRIGLTPATHFIASTGIQGGSGERFARVSMDAYAVAGVPDHKIRHVQAPEHLSPTHVYGVAFERATAVELGDRDFLFVSGTASIDRHGEIVHPGDVSAQTGRTLENISALLDAACFARADLAHLIVYLRDASDHVFVEPLVSEYAKQLPTIYVRAPVCRPGWLVEIEAMAARAFSPRRVGDAR